MINLKLMALTCLMMLNTCAQTKEDKKTNKNIMQDSLTLNNVVDRMWSEMPKFEQ